MFENLVSTSPETGPHSGRKTKGEYLIYVVNNGKVSEIKLVIIKRHPGIIKYVQQPKGAFEVKLFFGSNISIHLF